MFCEHCREKIDANKEIYRIIDQEKSAFNSFNSFNSIHYKLICGTCALKSRDIVELVQEKYCNECAKKNAIIIELRSIIIAQRGIVPAYYQFEGLNQDYDNPIPPKQNQGG